VVTDKIWTLKKPVIAAINGFCLGGGLEYAMCCDLRLAAENAKLGCPEVNLGILPGSGGTQRMPRLIGLTKAKELCMTGAIIDSQEALELGLVNYVYPKETLMEETCALANKITKKSPAALALIKAAMNRGVETDLETALLFEIDSFALCFATEQQKILMMAFLNKKR
jgi:enoyl-CoA hydratase